VVLVWNLVFCLSSVAAERQILQGHLPGPVNHLAPSGRLDAAKHLKLSITLPSRDPDGLANRAPGEVSTHFRRLFLKTQNDPGQISGNDLASDLANKPLP